MNFNKKTEKRKKDILKILRLQDKIKVKEIASRFDVSEMTARRDLKKMEEKGLVKRTFGGAIFTKDLNIGEEPYVIDNQITKNIYQKNRIAEKAASFICEGETIFFDSGSTVPFIEKFIEKNLSFTAFCYTFQSALGFYRRKNVKLILSGGILEDDSNILYNEDSANFVRKFRADKVFLSAGGVSLSMGLTTYFYSEVEIKKAMIKSAKKKILVTDSTKFGKISSIFFGIIEELDIVITDVGIPNEYIKEIESRGIELYIV